MTGRECIQETLSLVDLSKLGLSSYNISRDKFDRIADVYRRLQFGQTMVVFNSEKSEPEKKEEAFKTLMFFAENDNPFSYESLAEEVKRIGNAAAERVKSTTLYWNEYRERELREAKKNSNQKMMKDRMRLMLNFIKDCNDGYPEVFLDKVLSDGYFEKNLELFRNSVSSAKAHQTQTAKVEESAEETVVVNEELAVVEPTENIPEQENTAVHDAEKPVQKKPFWKRLFSR